MGISSYSVMNVEGQLEVVMVTKVLMGGRLLDQVHGLYNDIGGAAES